MKINKTEAHQIDSFIFHENYKYIRGKVVFHVCLPKELEKNWKMLNDIKF